MNFLCYSLILLELQYLLASSRWSIEISSPTVPFMCEKIPALIPVQSYYHTYPEAICKQSPANLLAIPSLICYSMFAQSLHVYDQSIARILHTPISKLDDMKRYALITANIKHHKTRSITILKRVLILEREY